MLHESLIMINLELFKAGMLVSGQKEGKDTGMFTAGKNI
jgi:hypothetical protein